MKTYAVVNQKGGVGKTSVAVNLSATLAHYGQRVLLVDLDPQGNATTGSGIDKNGSEKTLYGVLLEEYPAAEARATTEAGYDILIANRELAGAEIEMVLIDNREFRLKTALATIEPDYKVNLLPELSTSKVEVFEVEMRSLNNVRVKGFYAKPKEKRKSYSFDESKLVRLVKSGWGGIKHLLQVHFR